ncbi:MAG: hypothetical protein Q7Q71_04240 [Verrucomicrobiota bacterium JB023]|nr:hypothetical protein [Verrucomicrobiota bacterium JB023]
MNRVSTCWLLLLLSWLSAHADLQIAGSSVTPIMASDGTAATGHYEIGYFASDAVPDSAGEWADFTPISAIEPNEIGIIDQTGEPTQQSGQFSFAESLASKEEAGLIAPNEYPRRLGIRFFSSGGQESNVVTAANDDWLLRNPESFAVLGADLNLADGDLLWRGGEESAFRLVESEAPAARPRVVAISHLRTQVQIQVDQLTPAATYQLFRGESPESTAVPVGQAFTGGVSHLFTDPSPPPVRAFYRVVAQ